jgi:hypothetical protein
MHTVTVNVIGVVTEADFCAAIDPYRQSLGDHWTSEQLRHYGRFHEGSIILLKELSSRGFPSKPVRTYIFDSRPGTAGWCHDTITLYKGVDAGAVAHEFGHSLHESIRKRDQCGEAFAEAIRWFVEERVGPGSWYVKFRSRNRDQEILKACDFNYRHFVEMLRAGAFPFQKCWKLGKNLALRSLLLPRTQ